MLKKTAREYLLANEKAFIYKHFLNYFQYQAFLYDTRIKTNRNAGIHAEKFSI